MLFFAKLHYQIQGHHDSIVRKIFYVIPSTVRWRVAVAAGLNVIVSNSCGPETLTVIVAELGDQAHRRRGRAGQRYRGGVDSVPH